MRCCIPTLLLVTTVLLSAVHGVFLPLERSIPPTGHRVEVAALKARDRARHARMLRGVAGGVVDFSVQGTSDPNSVGLYYTKVKMGTPPKEFNVQIDTGSDILWVNCNTCSNCPQSSQLGIELNFFDTVGSSTAALIPCSDPICTSRVQGAAAECSPRVNQCSYTFQYGDGSGTSGYYVSDAMYFSLIMGQPPAVNSSATIVFGCSISQSGDLTKTDKAVDGIFGFGPGPLSVVSQLSSRGITPKVFSHCLKGDGDGGGVLVLGEILEPSIVYSPLVPSQPHYNLNLQSIAVNGQLLPINPAVFSISNNRGGTIVDCGTTLAYLIQEAYDPLVTADGAEMWCIGFQKFQEGASILGDLVLKDKIVVYDIAQQRIGWANYDCSLSVNVSVTTSKDEYINAGQLHVSSSEIHILSKLLPVSFVALSMYIMLV
ncbi:hypothetical protein GLYMA_13G148100v4 [Glycine max]|nr:hypothetical protein GLYMA_13G148100v4 [Glycine max]KAH1101578.1 hypothetical protein GYH30_036239 [Glycine max]